MLITPLQRGVTLIELIIGIAVLSILLAIGMPSFGLWIQNTQTRTAAESILNGLQLARNEAVRRNANVRFSLTNATGVVAWQVGCESVREDCPADIQSHAAGEGGGNARVGVSTSSTAYATALAIGAGMAAGGDEEEGGVVGAGVTFNGMGAIPAGNVGSDMARIDVMNVASTEARRLVIIIGSGGAVRMCDPHFSLAENAQGCS